MSNYHTPGKWSLHPYRYDGIEITGGAGPNYKVWSFSVGSGDKIVAQATGNTNGGGGWDKADSREEVLANARLSSAAPEMFELMERVVSRSVEPYELKLAAKRIIKKVNGDV